MHGNFYVGILSAPDEKSRIRICQSVLRIRIRIKMSLIHNTAPYEATLLPKMAPFKIFEVFVSQDF
jgi:hypothetical protein